MEKTFGLFFHLKKNKDLSKDEQTIYMKITVNGVSCEISTKRKWDPDKWNSSAGRLNRKSHSIKALNSYLDTMQQKVFEAKRKLIETDKTVSPENIKNLVLEINKNIHKHMLIK